MFSFLNKKETKEESVNKINDIIKDLSDINIDKLLKYSKIIKTIQINTNNKIKNTYNQRLDDENNDKNKWKYMTEDILNETKQLSEYDIIYRSRFSNVSIFNDYNYIEIFGKHYNKIIMADYLMFNNFYNLDYELVDRLLSYCKIKIIDDYSYKIDGWIFEQTIYNTPNYIIKYNNSDYDDLDFVKTEEDKRLTVRLLIQVMNETPDEYINFNNYNTITQWYYHNDNYINSYNSNIFNIKKNEENKKLESNEISKDELFIELEDKFTEDELISLLEMNSKYSKEEIKELGLNIKSNESTYNINTRTLDLNKFYENNGYVRTIFIIDYLKKYLKCRVNCNNYPKSNGEKITKEELLASLYNFSFSFGMGFLQSDDNILTLEETKKYCTNYEYFDYLRGKAMKISFYKFPIIDFERFDKYNGQGKFMECLLSIK